MKIPDYVQKALNILNAAGHEAYIVGGCVRDFLMNKTPSDWDITTSALPHQTEAAFTDFRTFRTGIQHGTITLYIDGHNVEITTFRIDGEYLDNRHPDSVTFTPNLEDDLKRRDFTINAMAYNPDRGIIDLFDGQSDLAQKTIRCVGDATSRFTEDALRIMRALRFAAVCGFDIESETAQALRDCKHLLDHIARERIATELNKILQSHDPAPIFREYSDVFARILPEITPAINFNQDNPHHNLDLWEHILYSLTYSPPKLPVRLALLFHDLAKPQCATPHKEGFTYFPDHPEKSALIASDILHRLRYDNKTRYTVKLLIQYHDSEIGTDKTSVKKMLRLIGAENFGLLTDVKLADNLAKHPDHRIHYEETLKVKELYEEILKNNECFSLRNLAVNGSDLPPHIKGPQIGNTLERLLDMVIEGKCENEKNALLRIIESDF